MSVGACQWWGGLSMGVVFQWGEGSMSVGVAHQWGLAGALCVLVRVACVCVERGDTSVGGHVSGEGTLSQFMTRVSSRAYYQ